MASERAIGAALKLLGRAFAGVVDEARIEVYTAALEDLSDEELRTATTLVIRQHTREFIPPPAVLRKAIAPAPVAIDGAGIIRRIEKLATYNPNVGMIYPPTDTVREQLGDAAAYAYAAAGGPRLFSENETGRDIAVREFQRVMVEAASRPQALLPVIGSSSLSSSDGTVRSIVDATAKRLAAGGAR
jgi:hypothetical protein